MTSPFTPHVDVAHSRDVLRTELENARDWRVRKTIEFPDDERNGKAAQLLERLIKTVDEVGDDLIKLFALHFDPDEEESSHIAELEFGGLGSALRRKARLNFWKSLQIRLSGDGFAGCNRIFCQT